MTSYEKMSFTQTSHIDNVSCSRIYKVFKVIEIFMKQYNFPSGRSCLVSVTFFYKYPRDLTTKIQNVKVTAESKVVETTMLEVKILSLSIFLAII